MSGRGRGLAGWWPLAVIVAAGVAVAAFGAQHLLSVDMVRAWQGALRGAVAADPVLIGLGFVVITAIYLMLSLPAEGLLTALCGMLFGTVLASLITVAGAVVAALLLFVGLRLALRRQLAAPHGETFERLLRGLARDGFNYLLMLRLFPVLPFSLISLVAVLVRMRAWPYLLATAIGVIPPTVVFASLGGGLGALLAQPGPVDLGSLVSARTLLPLAGLAALSVLPVAGRAWRGRGRRRRGAASRGGEGFGA